jgi:hypothetical protein
VNILTGPVGLCISHHETHFIPSSNASPKGNSLSQNPKEGGEKDGMGNSDYLGHCFGIVYLGYQKNWGAEGDEEAN